MMKIKDVLAAKGRAVYSIDESKTVFEAIQSLVQHKVGALLVLDAKGKLVGIISERDILRECAERYQQLKSTKVRDIMTKDVIIGLLNDNIDYTMGVMTNNRIRHLPIMEDDEIVGIISIGDVVKHQLHDREYENRYLQQYMFGH